MKSETIVNILIAGLFVMFMAGVFVGDYTKTCPEQQPCPNCETFCPEKVCPEIPSCPEIPEHKDCVMQMIEYKLAIEDMEKVLE